MKKLILQIQTSVDGFIADAKDRTDWMVWNWGAEWTWDAALQKHFVDLHDTVDTVLLSRKMAEEGFIGHWARVAANPDGPQYAFAKSITAAPKVVFTKTLNQSVWENTSLAKGSLVSEVTKLKNLPGKNMIVYGGASFVSALIEAGLIDEFHLFVNPIALGSGLSIFKDPGHKLSLQLVNTQSYECGVTVLTYLPPRN
ncbi:dihydrofolate reductase family protein [Paraflavitalea speifideaquila]|uniref:dihydrofolate reductase family protein n=1 Tax=Paraflavitalea speifideaquila TaxID=3076558 RepID=UPI0028E33E1A|nr:dihydrofolate reductase family protein [Paraflavitalea speifideiaquila]